MSKGLPTLPQTSRLDRILVSGLRLCLALQLLSILAGFGFLFHLGPSQQPRTTPAFASTTMSGTNSPSDGNAAAAADARRSLDDVLIYTSGLGTPDSQA